MFRAGIAASHAPCGAPSRSRPPCGGRSGWGVAALIVGLIVGCPTAARASLDPESREPYRLTIVVHFGENRIMTPVFQEQTRRVLRDWFQGALGAMVEEVNVVDRHPLLPQVLARGLDDALNGQLQPVGDWRPVLGVKTHFVLIDYADGVYDVQARQQDGSTGLASPVVRRGATPDRQLVARLAARFIGQDFGIVGTLGEVDSRADSPEILITLRAGGLGVPLDRWLHDKDVFAVAQIVVGRGGERAFPVPFALLVATEEPHDGVCRCRLYHRYQNPLAGAGATLGYRCLKLGTTTGPLRLHLVGEKLLPLDYSVRVVVTADGFKTTGGQEPAVSRSGVVRTDPRQPYSNLAFVTITSGQEPLARIPAPIIENYVEVVPLAAPGGAPELAALDIRKRHAIQQIHEARSMLSQLFKQIGQTRPHEAALERGQAGLEELDREIAARRSEVDNLAREAQAAKLESKLDLGEAEAGLKDLLAYRDQLRDFVGKLEAVRARETSPENQKLIALVGQAQAAEAEGHFGQATAFYREALPGLEGKQKADLQKHLEDLQRVINTRNPDHAEAKRFFEEVWPRLRTARDLKENLARARKALDACKAAGDYLSPRVFILANVAHGAELRKRIETLGTQDTEDARAEVKLIGDVAPAVEDLDKEVRAYVGANQPKGK